MERSAGEVLQFEAIGTHWRIDLPTVAQKALPPLRAQIEARIESFDATYSRFRADALVSRMAQKGGDYTLPDDAAPMLALYAKLYQLTDGKVTPLVGDTLDDAGYGAGYSLRPKAEIRKVPPWDEVIEFEAPTLHMKQPAMLDFGAAGKGYLVDLVAQVIAQAEVADFTINAGGDILHRGQDSRPLRVGLEHPQDPKQAIGVIELGNQSICASSGNRRAWGDWHHIIDPQSAQPVKAVIAAWVVADSTLEADGLATALFFTDPAHLLTQFEFEYAIVNTDQSVKFSKVFEEGLF